MHIHTCTHMHAYIHTPMHTHTHIYTHVHSPHIALYNDTMQLQQQVFIYRIVQNFEGGGGILTYTDYSNI